MQIKKICFLAASSFLLLNTVAQTVKKDTGKASFYGNKFHGRKTSSGVAYHKDSLTCAHKTLPFGTLLKVTNQVNGKEVIVKVTDRGPFVRDRVVDLSLAAAKELNFIAAGVASVEIQPVTKEEARLFALQKESQKENKLELRMYDPATGNFYAATEWVKRDQERRQALAQAEMQKRMLAQKEQLKKKKPNFKILNDHLTARND